MSVPSRDDSEEGHDSVPVGEVGEDVQRVRACKPSVCACARLAGRRSHRAILAEDRRGMRVCHASGRASPLWVPLQG